VNVTRSHARVVSPNAARAVAVVGLLCLVTAHPVAQAKRAMTIVDTIEVPIVADPQVSPDGQRVAFLKLEADWPANRLVPHIHVASMDGTGEPVQLTFDARGESSPRWSPDGRTLAFVARRDGDTVGQIYLLPFAGGGEARRLTTLASPPASVAWSPDGQALYYLASDTPLGEERERQRLQDDVYAFEENWRHRRLWKVDLTGTAVEVSPAGVTVPEYSLSADGRRIVHVRAPSPLPDDSERQEVWVMTAEGADAVQVTDNGVAETGTRLSPDGSTVLFLAEANQRFEAYYQANIFTVSATGGTPVLLLPDEPFEVETAQWSATGDRILFVANLGVHRQLMETDAAGRSTRALTSGDHALGNWRTYAGGHVFTLSEPTRSELWRLETRATAPTPITRLHLYLETTFALARQEKITWTGRDGTPIEGILNYPIDYQPGTRYPLVVQTHGGPAQSDKFGSLNNPFSYLQVLAGRGYAVLRPNYRGSVGDGDAFLRDVVGGYFSNQQHDVLLGVDHVVAMGVADPDRLIKMGWSAGGHLTNKLVTMTDRFKAAISGAGGANWVSLHAQSDTRAGRTIWFGGTPWDANAPFAAMWAQSPLSEVWKVQTPTLLLVGERDVRVPKEQSIEMYRALVANGVPTRLLVAPREPHSWGELRHVLGQANAGLEWMEKYARGREYTWERAPGDVPSQP